MATHTYVILTNLFVLEIVLFMALLLDPYDILRNQKDEIFLLVNFEFKNILRKVKRRLTIRQSLRNLWRVLIVNVIFTINCFMHGLDLYVITFHNLTKIECLNRELEEISQIQNKMDPKTVICQKRRLDNQTK